MNNTQTRKNGVVLVTGAGGFLGRYLCKFLADRGHTVRALVRNLEEPSELPEFAREGIYKCDLPSSIDRRAFDGDIAAVIHCAFYTGADQKGDDYRTNIEGSEALVKLTRSCTTAPFVFISSLSAHESTESNYGKHKWQVENMLDLQADLIIRPGLIVGDGGLFARMRHSIRRAPFVPLFYGGKQQIQIIRIMDLCRAIQKGINNELRGRYSVAANPPYPISDFYHELARLENKTCRQVLLPGAFSLAILRLFEALGFKLPISSENLLGLKHMRLADTTHDLECLGIAPSRSLQITDKLS